MKQYSITLKALSPLAIRADHAQDGSVTAKYVSGTTLMGSLAGVHRHMHGDRTDEFAALFLHGAVQYPNLYPAVFKDPKIQNATSPVYPLPKTAQSCKRFPGFQYQFEGHGVRDTLIDWALFSLGSDGKGLKAIEEHKDCNVCKESKYYSSMYLFPGYYRRDDEEPGVIMSAEVDKCIRLQTHTGINRRTGTVQESILYNREVFEEGMQFWGELKVADELASQFEKLVEDVGYTGLVRVGTGRTRGSGKVTLGIDTFNDAQGTFEAFKVRLSEFNEKLREQARPFDIQVPDGFYFAVTLHSPVILCDDLLRYEGTLSAKRLAQLVNESISVDTFKRVYQAASVRRVTGWNELWGMPKTNEFAIEIGSVFLFSCPSEPDNTLLHSLYSLEEQGIGRRKAEGFGRIRISDPFHREAGLL
ncbi:MAG TPA: RAMP superfamily CRISPR-associated protein [Ktedonobacteraceae bacterium]|nr:RAMP superfamily CRISPR-associated protein [Ktedonobacteraceae bacterium]